MKRYSKKELHKNFILLCNFFYNSEPIKQWVLDDEDYNGGYHEDIDFLISVIRKIGDTTGYELIMGFGDSHWNNMGENPFEEDFGGYEHTINIYEAVVEFIKWHKKQSK